MINIFGFLSYGWIFSLERQYLMFFSFECFFGLFLFLFWLSEIFDKILIVSSDFLGLAFNNIDLSLKLNDFIGVIFCSFICFSVHLFVVLNLIMILHVHLLYVDVFCCYCFVKLFLKLFLFFQNNLLLSIQNCVLLFVILYVLVFWFKWLIVLN